MTRDDTDPKALRLDIYGNPVDWRATGLRVVAFDGRLHAELVRGGSRIFPLCRPADGCASCAVPETHHCEVTHA